MSCSQQAPAPFACPSLTDSIQATAALLPRGRAWPGNDAGVIDRFLVWLAALAGAIPTAWPTGYVQAGVIAAIGTVRNFVETRWCALRKEFWCASANETLDLWRLEYGLPDPCDPRADLCIRVASPAGALCADLAALALRAGWLISCVDLRHGVSAFCGNARAGNALCGNPPPATVLVFTVALASSPAYSTILGAPPLAGRMLAGQQINCLPDITPLQCLLSRTAQAHLTLNYVLN